MITTNYKHKFFNSITNLNYHNESKINLFNHVTHSSIIAEDCSNNYNSKFLVFYNSPFPIDDEIVIYDPYTNDKIYHLVTTTVDNTQTITYNNGNNLQIRFR